MSDTYNSGTVTGNVTFTDNVYDSNPQQGTVGGTITFDGINVIFTIDGWTWDADTTNWIFTNGGQKWIFINESSNIGILNGDADVYYPAENPLGGTTLGSVTYYNYPSNSSESLLSESSDWLSSESSPGIDLTSSESSYIKNEKSWIYNDIVTFFIHRSVPWNSFSPEYQRRLLSIYRFSAWSYPIQDESSSSDSNPHGQHLSPNKPYRPPSDSNPKVIHERRYRPRRRF